VTIDTLHPLVAEYLKRLRRAAARLPAARRQELVAEIEAHLADALDPGVTDAEALHVLRRLGPPEAIVAAEQPADAADAPGRRRPSGRKEWLAIVLLLFGGFVAGVGWLAGAILLWTSRAWTVRQKLIGTLVVPGGLLLPFYILHTSGVSSTSCGGHRAHCAPTNAQIAWMVIAAVLVLASIATSTFLKRRARCGPG
jgi:uncharacterized membrane protein